MNIKNKTQQSLASLEEQEERKRNLQTQGRKGCKLQRINVALTPDNMDYLHILSKSTGMSMTKVVNKMMEQHRHDHMSIYDRAQELVGDLFSIRQGWESKENQEAEAESDEGKDTTAAT